MNKLFTPKNAANRLTVVLSLLALFQLALILGAPLGIAAYGGQYEVLPANLRAISISTVFIYVITIYVMRSRAGLSKTSKKDPLIVMAAWVIPVVFLYITYANIISASQYENFIMAPLSLLCAISALSITLSGTKKSK